MEPLRAGRGESAIVSNGPRERDKKRQVEEVLAD